ncbi:unnamed protein product [Camellia sinensis]
MAKSQNSKFKCFSGILLSLLYIGNLPTQPSDPTTDIPTTTTTFENPKKNFKTQVRTPGVAARLMGLDLLPDPSKVFRRKEDQKEKLDVDGRPPNVIAKLMGLDGLPPQQPLHRQHKGFSETHQQRTAPVSSQRDGKPYEHRSNRKDSTAQQECKDEHDVLETSKVERSSYLVKRTINSKLSEAEMAFIQQKFMADHGTFGQVFECLDNENLEHLAMMERLLGPLPQYMIISTDLRAEKYFKRSARLDWLEGASSKESTRAVWKLPRQQSQNSKFKCFSGILRSLLYIGNLPTQPSDPTTDIPTTTTTFENPKKHFKTQVRTPGVAATLMGLDLLTDPRKVFRRKEDQKEKCVDVDGRPPNVIAKLMGLDGLPPQQPLHRQHKGFPETYRQRTAPVSSQRDGKPYEHRSNRKDSTAQQECKDEHDVLETSNVERSSYPVKRTIN